MVLHDNMTVIDQLQRIKDVVVTYFKALFQKFLGEMEENYVESHIQLVAQGWILCLPRN
jgi:hypothetical protein